MKWISLIISVILILAGGVFALQGMSLLPSRVMYGKPEWIFIGAGMVIVGIAIIIYQRRKKKN